MLHAGQGGSRGRHHPLTLGRELVDDLHGRRGIINLFSQSEGLLWGGLIELIENDVEVLDFGDAFKAYKGKGRLLGPYDHHFDAAGIEIIATELGRRIRSRYDFAKTEEAKAGRKLFTVQTIQAKTPTFFLNYNGISAEEAKALDIPPTVPMEQVGTPWSS